MKAFFYDSINSTNEEAKRLIRNGTLNEPAYLLAREQTAGRGTRERRWASPKNAGIYLTIVETPFQTSVAPTGDFTLAAGIGCAEAILEIADVTVQLKPLNDLYLAGGKLGGILTEAIVQSGSVEALITGVGINVNKADRPMPADEAIPVCLEEVMQADRFRRLDINAFAASLVVKVRTWNALVASGRMN